MSESSILPGGVPGGGAGVPPPYGFDEPDGSDRRRLLIIGGAVGAVVLLLAAYLLLHGGGSSDDDSFTLPPHPVISQTPTPSGTSTSGTKPGTKLPPKSHTRIARDPFKALFSTAPPTTGTGTVTGASGTPVSSTTVAPGSPGSAGVVPTSPTEGGVPTTGTGGVVTHGNPIWVELVSTIGVKEAVFNVGYQDHKFRRFTVTAPTAGSTAGTIFDNEFSLLSIQGNEVTLQVGDDTPFDLRKGVSHQLV